MAYEFMRPDPGTVIFRDGLMYRWPDGGEWLPALAAWHADEAEDVGIQVREVPDPPADEPVPVVEVPVIERAVSVELPDDTVIDPDEPDVEYRPKRPKALSKTVKLPVTQTLDEGAEVVWVDTVVTQVVQPDEYVPPQPESDTVVEPADEPASEPAPAPESDEVVTPAPAADDPTVEQPESDAEVHGGA